MDEIITKKCSTCGEVKNIEDFPKDNRTRDGKRYDCKKCHLLAKHQEYDRNAENYRRRSQSYYYSNLEQCQERHRIYQVAHKEELKKIKRDDPQYTQKNRINHLKYVYGITPKEFDAILDEQGGGCICGRENQVNRHFYVDHNHTTGRVRGVLCDKCNHVLGLVGDSVQILKLLICYLEKDSNEWNKSNPSR